MAYMMKLPDERGAQLKMIAAQEGKTAVEVISDMIRAKLAEHALPTDLPGVSVTRTKEMVRIELPGFGGEVSANEAAKLADGLREASVPMMPADRERKQRLLEGLDGLTGIKVERMASGVRLVSPITGQKYAVNFGVASDLADQIDRAAK